MSTIRKSGLADSRPQKLNNLYVVVHRRRQKRINKIPFPLSSSDALTLSILGYIGAKRNVKGSLMINVLFSWIRSLSLLSYIFIFGPTAWKYICNIEMLYFKQRNICKNVLYWSVGLSINLCLNIKTCLTLVFFARVSPYLYFQLQLQLNNSL